MSKLVLASASPRREELLKQLKLKFTVVPGRIDESLDDGLLPVEMVEKLAQKKILKVANLVEDAVIIAADTIVVFNNKILGKPADHNEAKKMLEMLQGKEHQVFTSIAIYQTNDKKMLVKHDQTTVKMIEIELEDIEKYIKTGEPMDKAGAYGIQGIGGIFVEEIRGSYYTVMGLPIHLLTKMLKEFAIGVL